jgi:DNA-directed RNA polymerase omega subunit
MARISAEKAVEVFGGNRFEMVLAASQRARELKNGHAQLVSGKDASSTITALREIEEGKYTRKDWLDKIPSKQKKNKGHRDEYFPT